MNTLLIFNPYRNWVFSFQFKICHIHQEHMPGMWLDIKEGFNLTNWNIWSTAEEYTRAAWSQRIQFCQHTFTTTQRWRRRDLLTWMFWRPGRYRLRVCWGPSSALISWYQPLRSSHDGLSWHFYQPLWISMEIYFTGERMCKSGDISTLVHLAVVLLTEN